MKKFKKILTMGLAAIMAISAISMSAFAADGEDVNSSEDNSVIDYTVYDEDMQYIPAHAEIIEQYNQQIKRTRATSYSAWSWSAGIYSRSTGSACAMIIPFYFTPVYNYLYFNVEVTGSSAVPYMTVNKYLSDGSLSYVGSYAITSSGSNTYEWSNKKRTLTAGTNYVFCLLNDTNWSSATMDIYKTSM